MPAMSSAVCSRGGGHPTGSGPCLGLSILSEVNHQPESRVREICTHGSEGVWPKPIGHPYPYQTRECDSIFPFPLFPVIEQPLP